MRLSTIVGERRGEFLNEIWCYRQRDYRCDAGCLGFTKVPGKFILFAPNKHLPYILLCVDWTDANELYGKHFIPRLRLC